MTNNLSERTRAAFGFLTRSAKLSKVKFGAAKIWHEWLATKPGLDAILSYRVNGEELFFPPRAEA